MSPSVQAAPTLNRLAALLRRESVTAAMIRQIDEKLNRLGSARRERANALKAIRCELARAQEAGPLAPEIYER